jgi:hypothetical protein
MEPEYSGSSSQRPLGIAPARPLDSWEQFYAGGRWTYRRDAGRGASWLSRSTDAGCAFCQYEPFLDRPTLAVLFVSTSLMIGVFAALYIGFFAR